MQSLGDGLFIFLQDLIQLFQRRNPERNVQSRAGGKEFPLFFPQFVNLLLIHGISSITS